jgi:hypothetical protein
MVQQLTRSLHNTKEPHILLKLDISKAFDSIYWSFLLDMLQHLGFGRNWCNLISLLLCTSSTRILVNGEPGEYIMHHRGLRQGDPLSPMLFILVMEALNAMVSYALREHILQPIASQQAKHCISFYVDDVVLFMWPSHQDILAIISILDIFGHATGLKTNISKSSVTPIQCGKNELTTISALLPCDIKKFLAFIWGFLYQSVSSLTSISCRLLIKLLINFQILTPYYHVIFIDDHSRYAWIYFMKRCSELPFIYKSFTRMVHTQFSTTIKIFRLESGGEFLSDHFHQILTLEGTLAQLSCPGAHAQNGVAERKHRHIIESARTILISFFVPSHF